MRLLITLAVVWVGLSIPLSLAAGRILRSARTPTLVEEIEAYLRARAPKVPRRAAGSAFAVVGAFALAVGFGTQAGRQLPEEAIVQLAEWQERAFPEAPTTSSSTTRPATEALLPTAEVDGPVDVVSAALEEDDGPRRRASARAEAALPPPPAPGAAATGTSPRRAAETTVPGRSAEPDGEDEDRSAARRSAEPGGDGDERPSRRARSRARTQRGGGAPATTTTAAPVPSTTTTSTTTPEPPPGTTTTSTTSTTSTTTTSTTSTTVPPDEGGFEQQGGEDPDAPEEPEEPEAD